MTLFPFPLPIPPPASARSSLPLLLFAASLLALALVYGCQFSGAGDRAPKPLPLIGKTAFDPEKPGSLDQARLDESRDAPLEEQVELMGICVRLKNMVMSETLAKRILEENPDEPEALRALAQVELSRKNLDEADRLTNQLLKLAPDAPDNISLRAEVLLCKGQAAEALSMLTPLKKKSEAENEGAFTYQQQYAYTLYENGMIPGARAAFREIIGNGDYPEVVRADARKQIRNIERDELLKQGSLALRKFDLDEARDISRHLLEEHADHEDSIAFSALVLSEEGKVTEAAGILRELKAAKYQDKPFPYEYDLAVVLDALGNVDEAESLYTSYLQRTPDLTAYERLYIDNSIRELRERDKGNISLGGQGLSVGEGDRWTAQARFQTGFHRRFQVGAYYKYLDIKLDENVSARGNHLNPQEAAAFVKKLFDKGYYTEATIGATEERVLYGISLGKRSSGRGPQWVVGFAGNRRSVDSLTLEALDGYENRASAQINKKLSERLYLNGGGYLRRVKVGDFDEVRLGDGGGANVELSYLVRKGNPAITVGPVWQYEGFSTSSRYKARSGGDPGDLPDSSTLINPQYNRAGVETGIEGRLSKKMLGYGTAGLYYQFGTSPDFEAGARGGLRWEFRENLALILEGAYSSRGRTAQNFDSSEVEGSLRLSTSF